MNSKQVSHKVADTFNHYKWRRSPDHWKCYYNKNNVEKIKNKAFGLVTGAIKTTNAIALKLFTNNPPI